MSGPKIPSNRPEDPAAPRRQEPAPTSAPPPDAGAASPRGLERPEAPAAPAAIPADSTGQVQALVDDPLAKRRAMEMVARNANAEAIGKSAWRKDWTFEDHFEAAKAHATACLAYWDIAASGDTDPTSFAARQRDAHRTGLERHLVGLYEVSMDHTQGVTPQPVTSRLEEARVALLKELPGWLAEGCGAPGKGGYVTLQVQPNGDLKISLNPDARGEVEDLKSKATDAALGVLLSDFTECGDLDWVYPEEISALTDAPIVSFSAERDDEGRLLRTTSVFWHERYAVEDPIQELLEHGEVIFEGCRSDVEPEEDGDSIKQQIQVTKKLVSSEHGVDDFDISGLAKVHRVCVPHKIRSGDIFNVYLDDSVKLGATWCGSVEKSLANFAETHPGYLALH